MSTPFKRGGKPYSYDLKGFLFRNSSLAKGQAIAVVVGAIPDSDLLRPTKAAADAFYPIGDDGLAVAGATENDPALNLAAGDRLGHGTDEIGIIARGLGVGAAIADRVAFGQEHGLDLFLVGEAGVIRADGDGESFHI